MDTNYDFSGWATKNDTLCGDGRIIKADAFKMNDGMRVPLVWNHDHSSPKNTLGHGILENRPQGVYIYGYFNDTEDGKRAKELVEHGDITALSVCATQIKQKLSDVIHGNIREVSLVLAGQNPGALIDTVLSHGTDDEEEGYIFTDETIVINHSDNTIQEEKKMNNSKDTSSETEDVETIFNTLTDKQKEAVYAIIGQIMEDEKESKVDEIKQSAIDDSKTVTEDSSKMSEEIIQPNTNEKGEDIMKHNAFDGNEEVTKNKTVISAEDETAIFADVKRYGSLKESSIQHGITNIDYLFPDAQNITNVPEFIKRPDDWVAEWMNSVHHTPFSRIKSMFADITADDARAKGYVKGNLKLEEVFSLLKRTTTPQTIYKKQKLDRDDMIDITGLDVAAWIKSEMRGMLDEEIARACLVGDGRLASSDDKIKEDNLRPIWTDADLYTIKKQIAVASTATDDAKAKAFIRGCIKARKDYRGSGNPNLYTTEDVISDCLLMEDTTGRIIYDTIDKLAAALRVRKIIAVSSMESKTRTASDVTYTLWGIIVNPSDYNIGADRGGSVNMFDDFDIDYNAQKYLIETRISAALTKPYSAIAVEMYTTAAST